MTNGRVEVITSVERRRRWSGAEKERLVAATLEPGASVSAIAREAGIQPGQLYGWRRQLRARSAIDFAPVRIASEAASAVMASGAAIEIEFATGARMRITGAIDRATLATSNRGAGRWTAAMIPLPTGVRVWLATGYTDMRKGFPSLALQVQEMLHRDPLGGHLFCFRGRRGNLLKVIWHDGQGACLFTKRLERGRFLWPSPADGVVTISSAQFGYLLSGIDWRHPQETWRPTSMG